MEFSTYTLADLPTIATALLNDLHVTKIITFEGQMGAGKTTLIQFILRAMGIEETDGSPTYSLVNVYNSPYFGIVNHFDLYRLNSLEEVFDIGFEEMLYANQICLIEWADLVLDELPENTIHVKITTNEDGTRQISW